MMLFRELFDEEVAVEEMDPAEAPADLSPLFPEEAAMMVRAVDKRRREFTAGRILVRRGMARMGWPAGPLVNGDDRAPRWPEGLVGSITHTAGRCAVGLAPRSALRGIGLDVESDTPLERRLWRMLFTAPEEAWLSDLPAEEQGRFAKLIFCAKECAYKAQYLITRQYLGFSAMTVEVDVSAQRWQARFNEPSGSAFSPGDLLDGGYRIRDGFIAAGLTIGPA